MDLTSLVIQFITGAIGGNVAGMAVKDKSLGTLGNSIAGVIGGAIVISVVSVIKGMNKS